MGAAPTVRKKLHNSHGVWKAVIVDIDGVIADSISLLKECYDGTFNEFHKRLLECKPLDNGVQTIVNMAYESGHAILMLSARPDTTQVQTVRWLRNQGFEYDALRLRPPDMDPLEFKSTMVDNTISSRRLAPTLAIDDDPEMVEMYKSKGIPCLYIHSGCYEPLHQWRQDA